MKSNVLGVLAAGLLAGAPAADALTGTWYFAAPAPGKTYTGQVSFTDLDLGGVCENSQGAGFAFAANFPIDVIVSTSPIEVPEPGSLALLGLAFGGLRKA